MFQRFVFVFCFLAALVLIPVLAQTQGALAPEESIIKTTVANTPVSYSFGADDYYTDTIVHITTQAACELKVTRIPVHTNEILTRCGNAFHPTVMVSEEDQPKAGGSKHPSIYRIEPVGVCSAGAFPVQIDISYFGDFQKRGPNPPNNKVFRLRMIHDPSDGSGCRDITTGVTKLPNDPDPKGSGGEGGGFSNFFLVNLHDTKFPDRAQIGNEFDKLITLAGQHISSEQQKVMDAKQAFLDGDTNSSKPKFEESLQKLKAFKSAVDSARAAQPPTLTPGQAKGMQALAPQISYNVQQFAAGKNIDVTIP